MLMDLSVAPDDALGLVLLHVPIKELLKNCTQVSKQWNRVLAGKGFWRDKMALDGFTLEWPKLAGLDPSTYKFIAYRLICEREIKEIERFRSIERIRKCDNSQQIHFQLCPLFMDGLPHIRPYVNTPTLDCLANGYDWFYARNELRLGDVADIRASNMDNIGSTPTIVVTGLVGNRQDCPSIYRLECWLCKTDSHFPAQFEQRRRMFQQEKEKQWDKGTFQDENHSGVLIQMRFKQGDVESWTRVRHEFKDYPAEMRYLMLKITVYKHPLFL